MEKKEVKGKDPVKEERLRTKVAQEFVATETSYVESLQTLVDLYIIPLTAKVNEGEPIVSQSQIAELFSTIQVILGLNQVFCNDLVERLNKWSSKSCLGDVIGRFIPYFKMYTEYVKNNEHAFKLLHEDLNHDDSFQEFCDLDPRAQGQSLESFLIKPIQRIPRYKLLVAELLKHTPQNHPDQKDLSIALEAVDKVAHHINQEVARRENREQIMNIQKDFVDNVEFIAPNRQFIRKGTLLKKCRSSDVEYMFFLFNDLLVYASTVGWKFKLHQNLPINTSFLIEDLPDLKWIKNRFKIISTKKSFIVYANDYMEKVSWMTDICNCIALLNKTTKGQEKSDESAPIWQSDKSSKLCMKCQETFSIFNRRHHCRKCGILVCNNCSLSRMIVPGRDNKYPQRVCDNCAREIRELTDKANHTGDNILPYNHAPLATTERRQTQSKIIMENKEAPCLPAVESETTMPNRNLAFPLPLSPRSRKSLHSHNPAVFKGPQTGTSTKKTDKETSPRKNTQQTSPKPMRPSQSTGNPVISTSPRNSKVQLQSKISPKPNKKPTSPKMKNMDTIVEDKPLIINRQSRSTSVAMLHDQYNQHRVLYSFKARSNEELDLNIGDIIKVIQKDKSGWWYGSIKDKNGLFPSNYTEPLAEPLFFMQAICDLSSADTEILNYRKKDMIRVYDNNQSLYLGENINSGKSGWFDPKNFIQVKDPKSPTVNKKNKQVSIKNEEDSENEETDDEDEEEERKKQFHEENANDEVISSTSTA